MFDHEKLNVYQAALRFLEWLNPILEAIPKTFAAHDQLDRASLSMLLNIAEGNGKTAVKDRCRFFEMARGSALECAAILDALGVKKLISGEQRRDGKLQLESVVAMLVGLLRRLDGSRLGEEMGWYSGEQEREQEQEQEHGKE